MVVGIFWGEDVAFEISGTNSKCFDLKASTGFEAIEWSRCNWNDNASRGEIDGYRQGLESGTGYFGGQPNLTLSGTWLGGYFIDASIVRNIDPAMTEPLFKAGVGFTMASRFRSNQNVDLNATCAYLDFAPANFTNPSTLQLEECLISRNGAFDAADTTILPNINKADLPSAFTGNVGIQNTFEGGRATITTESVTTITTINVWVDAAGTWTASDLEHFSMPVNGQVKHDGVSPDEYEAAINVQIEGVQNNVVGFKLQKWDDSASIFVDILEAEAVVNAFAGVRDVAFITETANVTLNQNDYLKAQLRNTSGTGNLTLENGSFYRVKER